MSLCYEVGWRRRYKPQLRCRNQPQDAHTLAQTSISGSCTLYTRTVPSVEHQALAWFLHMSQDCKQGSAGDADLKVIGKVSRINELIAKDAAIQSPFLTFEISNAFSSKVSDSELFSFSETCFTSINVSVATASPDSKQKLPILIQSMCFSASKWLNA